MALRSLSLCAGIGGIDLGLAAALGPAHRTVCYVERDIFCAAILASRMADRNLNDAPIWSDVKTFNSKPWRGIVDIITAGYPCQPFSQAGKRQGTGDVRHLWPHIVRHIKTIQPAYVFCENVPGHLTLGFEQVCGDLQRMGYNVAAGLFSAEECGADHQRQRLYFLAHTDRFGVRDAKIPDRHRRISPKPTHHGEEEFMAYAGTEWKKPGAWPIEPSVGRVADGVPHRLDRLRTLGNAVVPATAALAWRTLNS